MTTIIIINQTINDVQLITPNKNSTPNLGTWTGTTTTIQPIPTIYYKVPTKTKAQGTFTGTIITLRIVGGTLYNIDFNIPTYTSPDNVMSCSGDTTTYTCTFSDAS